MYKVLPTRPVEPNLIEILVQVTRITDALGIPFFVGGAMARDIVLVHVFNQDSIRATRDVDLGLLIKDWEEFTTLKNALIETGDFSELKGVAQRLMYRHNTPLDLIPFGGVSNESQSIAWPPDQRFVMNVAGFEDALNAAITVEVQPQLQTKVSSLPALAVLKLLAWKDRGHHNNKDALDFDFILRRYGPAQNEARLYEAEYNLLLTTQGDPEWAGAILLGKDSAALCSDVTLKKVAEILENPTLRQQLSDHVLRANGQLITGNHLTFERNLNAFAQGFLTHPE